MCVGKEVAASGLAFGGRKEIYAKREGAVADISLVAKRKKQIRRSRRQKLTSPETCYETFRFAVLIFVFVFFVLCRNFFAVGGIRTLALLDLTLLI